MGGRKTGYGAQKNKRTDDPAGVEWQELELELELCHEPELLWLRIDGEREGGIANSQLNDISRPRREFFRRSPGLTISTEHQLGTRKSSEPCTGASRGSLPSRSTDHLS